MRTPLCAGLDQPHALVLNLLMDPVPNMWQAIGIQATLQSLVGMINLWKNMTPSMKRHVKMRAPWCSIMHHKIFGYQQVAKIWDIVDAEDSNTTVFPILVGAFS